jgi:hypothetical protein
MFGDVRDPFSINIHGAVISQTVKVLRPGQRPDIVLGGGKGINIHRSSPSDISQPRIPYFVYKTSEMPVNASF